jgi:HAD superfamily hydrolase (TIGR01509 family)
MFGENTPRDEMDAIAVEKEAAFRRIIEREVPLAPGLITLMDALKAAGVKLAVGSSAPPENVRLVIEQGRLNNYFDVCIDGSLVKRGKPAPDVFLAAASGLGLAPSACAVIEDAPPGIQAAVAAGTRAIGVATTHSRAQLLDLGAEIVFDSITAIPPSFLIT